MGWWHNVIVSKLLMWELCRSRSVWLSLLCTFLNCDEERNVAVCDFYFFLKLFQFVVDVRSMQLVFFQWFWCFVHEDDFSNGLTILANNPRILTLPEYVPLCKIKSPNFHPFSYWGLDMKPRTGRKQDFEDFAIALS